MRTLQYLSTKKFSMKFYPLDKILWNQDKRNAEAFEFALASMINVSGSVSVNERSIPPNKYDIYFIFIDVSDFKNMKIKTPKKLSNCVYSNCITSFSFEIISVVK